MRDTEIKPQRAHAVAAPTFDNETEASDREAARRASLADMRRQIQKQAAAAAAREDVHAAAERGIASPETSLPFSDQIQASFGPTHDVSTIRAHVGGDAAGAMGATAFASGDHVVFDREPDLHTAAHEAAHVVQQAQGVNLYGGVGEAGDHHERHADAVADRVVAGQSAADLLGPAATGPSSRAVQMNPKKGEDPRQTRNDAESASFEAVRVSILLCGKRVRAATEGVRRATEAPDGEGALAQRLDILNGHFSAASDEILKLRSHVDGCKSMFAASKLAPELELLDGAWDDFELAWKAAQRVSANLRHPHEIYDNLDIIHDALGLRRSDMNHRRNDESIDKPTESKMVGASIKAALDAAAKSAHSFHVNLGVDDAKLAHDDARVRAHVHAAVKLLNHMEAKAARGHVNEVRASLPALETFHDDASRRPGFAENVGPASNFANHLASLHELVR